MQYVLKNKCNCADKNNVVEIARGLNIEPLLARILDARGIKGVDEAQKFLYPTFKQMHDPFLFRDMANCVSLIKSKISSGERICIYGDYDVDGVSGSAILYKTLKKLGADAECVLPSRMEHGYGLSNDAVSKMFSYGLLITVDCGITNVAEISQAKAMGLNVIITDHHECGATLPQADYILNPKREGETYPYRELCGAGIAYKLACALMGSDAIAYLDIAAIATIADIVPLTGENRVIAKIGLKKLNNTTNVGLIQLAIAAKLKSGSINSRDVAFKLAPRMNAAGRISTARIVFDLLTTNDVNMAEILAKEINTLNSERKQRQERVISEALEMEEKFPSDKFIMHYSDDWDVGIIGLAASKLCDIYNKPTLLLTRIDDKYVGSARSIAGINIYNALYTQSNLFEKFGGHNGAAGLTVNAEHLNTVRNQINIYFNSNYTEESFLPSRYYDLILTPKEITNQMINDLNKLEPFGYKNEQVNILLKNSDLLNVKSIGSDKHTRFTLKSGEYAISATAFGTKADSLPKKADIIATAQISDFDGFPHILANTFSYPPTVEELLAEAEAHIKNCVHPKSKGEYFCNRRELGDIYSLLKTAIGKNLKFNDTCALLNFIQKKLSFITIQKFVFAINVLSELKLIEISKSANINIVVNESKCILTESDTYKKYYMEPL